MPSPIRLNKVLKELNISLDRAVEFLGSKKIEIEPRPTSKIDQNTYELLLDEFQTDKSDKDKLEEINTKKRKELEQKQAEESTELGEVENLSEEFKKRNVKTIGLSVEPGEYKPDNVLFTSGFNGSFFINCQSSWLIPKRNKFGSNEGDECMAIISPV